jgi:hypothetical protein
LQVRTAPSITSSHWLWVVKGAEHHAADQLQIVLVKRLGEDRRVFRHEADRPQLNAGVAGFRALGEHGAPGRVARIIWKLHAPGAGRIADLDDHVLEPSEHLDGLPGFGP